MSGNGDTVDALSEWSDQALHRLDMLADVSSGWASIDEEERWGWITGVLDRTYGMKATVYEVRKIAERRGHA